MAGATIPTHAPWPSGEKASVWVRLGGYVKQGLTAVITDTFRLPWDAKIAYVDLTYTKIGSADLDAVTLATVDDTKTIVASQDMSGSQNGTRQTLHSDVSGGYQIQQGDVIKTTADSGTANEEGSYFFTIGLIPYHA